MNFTEKIELIRRSSMGVPKKIEIDLAVPISDQLYTIAGNVFYVFSSALEADYVGIKVNEVREPVINYAVHCGLITPFYRLYITTPAGQTGTLTIIYATEAPELMEILDHRSTTLADMGALITINTAILDQLQGDVAPNDWESVTVGIAAVVALGMNGDRRSFWLHARSTNTVPIYVGFTNGVTVGGGTGSNWVAELLPGQGWGCDDYLGTIWVIASAANQQLGVGDW